MHWPSQQELQEKGRLGEKLSEFALLDFIHCSGNLGIQGQFSALLPLEGPVKVRC